MRAAFAIAVLVVSSAALPLAAQDAERPAEQSAEQAAERTAEQRVEPPTAPIAEQRAEQRGERPGERRSEQRGELPRAAEGADFDFDRIAALRAQGLDLPAVRLLEVAREARPAPRVSAELGLAYLGLGQAVDAETHLAEAVSAEGDAWIDVHRAGLLLALRHARASIGVVVVACEAEDAAVWVDGSNEPPSPCGEPLRAAAGDRVVEVRAPGFRSARTEVRVTPHETVEASATLSPFDCFTPGMEHMGGEQGGCCWPDQTWLEGACSGVPECPDGSFARGHECAQPAPPPPPRRLASFHVSLLAGLASFGRTDTSLFRPSVPAQGTSVSLGPRAELRVGFKLFELFGLELTAGGTMTDVPRWLDCPGGACAERAATAYTLDVGFLFVAHTDPPRIGGNIDLHLGLGARPYVRTTFDDDGGGSELTATVVPAELGASIFLADFVSLDVLGQAELWIPWEYCGHGADGARYCLGGDALGIELAWTALAGITFHAE